MRAGFGLLCAALCALCACEPANNICGERTEDLTGPDGGVVRCVVAEDCPRTGEMLLCVFEGGVEEPCVSCTDTRCVQHLPELCD